MSNALIAVNAGWVLLTALWLIVGVARLWAVQHRIPATPLRLLARQRRALVWLVVPFSMALSSLVYVTYAHIQSRQSPDIPCTNGMILMPGQSCVFTIEIPRPRSDERMQRRTDLRL